MKTINKILLLALLPLLLVSCKEDEPEKIDFDVEIGFNVDGLNVEKDTILYSNSAGNNYSVTKMEFFVYGITLHAEDGDDYTDDGYYYVNMDDPETMEIPFSEVTVGNYTGLSIYIGLPSNLNVTGALSIEDAHGLEWPDMMGGGYHFMKFEGNYVDTAGGQAGYRMHLGVEGNQVMCAVMDDFQVDATHSHVHITMDLNEWFKNPADYDFNTDGTMIMGNPTALEKLAANGVDVFGIME